MVAPYTNEITYKEGKCKEGWHDYKDSLIYVIILGLVQEFIPLLILIVTHIAMFYHLWKKNSGMQNQNSKQQQLAQLRMMKIQKTFIVIVIVFFILTLPYSISFIVTLYLVNYNIDFLIQHEKTVLFSQEIFWIMLVMNSCANPIIYGKNKTFLKAACKKIQANVTSSQKRLAQWITTRKAPVPNSSSTMTIDTIL